MRVFHSQTPGVTGFTSDVLSGKERIISFTDLHGPVERNTTARSLFALNFARAAFQKDRAAKGHIDTFFASIANRSFIEVDGHRHVLECFSAYRSRTWSRFATIGRVTRNLTLQNYITYLCSRTASDLTRPSMVHPVSCSSRWLSGTAGNVIVSRC